VEAVVERPFQVCLQWKYYCTADNRYPVSVGGWISRRLKLSCVQAAEWKKRSSFLYLLWPLESICCQSTKDPLGSSLSGWIIWISRDIWILGVLNRSCIQVAECGSVQSRYNSSGSTARNKSAFVSHSGLWWYSGGPSSVTLGFQSCETGSHFLVQIHNFVNCFQLLWLHWTYLFDPLIVVYFQ